MGEEEEEEVELRKPKEWVVEVEGRRVFVVSVILLLHICPASKDDIYCETGERECVCASLLGKSERGEEMRIVSAKMLFFIHFFILPIFLWWGREGKGDNGRRAYLGYPHSSVL